MATDRRGILRRSAGRISFLSNRLKAFSHKTRQHAMPRGIYLQPPIVIVVLFFYCLLLLCLSAAPAPRRIYRSVNTIYLKEITGLPRRAASRRPWCEHVLSVLWPRPQSRAGDLGRRPPGGTACQREPRAK